MLKIDEHQVNYAQINRVHTLNFAKKFKFGQDIGQDPGWCWQAKMSIFNNAIEVKINLNKFEIQMLYIENV